MDPAVCGVRWIWVRDGVEMGMAMAIGIGIGHSSFGDGVWSAMRLFQVSSFIDGSSYYASVCTHFNPISQPLSRFLASPRLSTQAPGHAPTGLIPST